jgi:hypothetical protein
MLTVASVPMVSRHVRRAPTDPTLSFHEMAGYAAPKFLNSLRCSTSL